MPKCPILRDIQIICKIRDLHLGRVLTIATKNFEIEIWGFIFFGHIDVGGYWSLYLGDNFWMLMKEIRYW